MLITVVNWQLNDSSYAASPFSTKADSSCYQSTVESGEAALIFSILYFTMANMWENVVNAFDQLWESDLPLLSSFGFFPNGNASHIPSCSIQQSAWNVPGHLVPPQWSLWYHQCFYKKMPPVAAIMGLHSIWITIDSSKNYVLCCFSPCRLGICVSFVSHKLLLSW